MTEKDGWSIIESLCCSRLKIVDREGEWKEEKCVNY